MGWPLHTTSEDDPYALIGDLLDGRRKFMWLHFMEEQKLAMWAIHCNEAGLVVLDQVPCWFLLACRKSVPKRDRLRMMQSITTSAGHDSDWRGLMFGYDMQDIDWFHKEIHLAMRRIEEYKRSLQ